MRVERLVAFCRFAVAAAAVAALLFLAAVPASAEKPPPPPAAHAADADGDKIFDDLERRIRSADVDQTFPAIVLLDQPSTSDGINGLHRRIGDFNVNSQYSTINGFAAKLTKGQIVALSRLDQVAQIEADLPVEASLDTATYWFGVQNARTDFGVDGNADGQPAYGTGDIVTAILDTGIDNAHVDLDGGKVVAWADLHQPVDPVNDPFCNSPCDPHSHGTHVSSIVAGEGEGNALYGGVAPGAALVGVRVLDRYGSGSTSTINAGIQWVIDNKDTYNIRIINMSLGSSGCSDGTDSMSQMVNQAVAAGIVVVVAAGNSGPAACTVSSPAAAEDAITVAAMADIGEAGFSLANFSSRGPTADGRIKPDISGPGVRVTAARSGTGSSYVSYSGTSMATPFVAGVAALMLDADPTLTPNEVKSLVMNTAVDWGPTGKDTDYGAGRLDAYEAVRTAKNASGTNIDVPNHQTVEGALATAGQPGDSDTYTIDITDATKPLAITLVMSTWSSSGDVDFDMELRDKDGVQVAISDWVDRQETIGITSPANGPYTLRVYAWSGSGPYFFDISVGGSIDGDADRDGVPDSQDNCPADSNPDQTNTDGDGMGDVCDPDDDNDGLNDDIDSCPLTSNPGQEDTDGDSVGDVCDNCPADSNPDQINTDGDGMGDVCDPDDDNDGVLDGDDNCPLTANPSQDDIDGDGRGNACQPGAPTSVPWGDGRIDVFARASDNGLWHRWYVGGQGWSGWESLGGVLKSGPDVSSWAEGRLDVFALGTDNELWHKWYVRGWGWSGWENLGAPTGLTLTSDPGAVSWGDGRIDVFARASDNALWHRWYVGGQGWSGWESLGGVLKSGPDVSSWREGRLNVFTVGTDNELWHKWYVRGRGWSGWENLGAPSGLTLISQSRPVSWGDGRIDVFARASDDRLWHRWYVRGQGWSGWEDLGGVLNSAPDVSSWAEGRLDVFTLGTDDKLRHKWYVRGKGWFPQGLWERL